MTGLITITLFITEQNTRPPPPPSLWDDIVWYFSAYYYIVVLHMSLRQITRHCTQFYLITNGPYRSTSVGMMRTIIYDLLLKQGHTFNL